MARDNKSERLFDEIHTELEPYIDDLIVTNTAVSKIDKKNHFTKEELISYIEDIYDYTSKIYPLSNSFYMLSSAIEEAGTKKLIENNINANITDYLKPKYPTYLGNYHNDLYKFKQKYFQLAIDLSYLFIKNDYYLWDMKSNSAPFRSPQFALTAHR